MPIPNDDFSMDFTGERIVTNINEYWTLEHLHRYAMVKELVKGKAVLDVACGEGYGSNILADYAGTVTGIDLSEDAIQHAKNKYRKKNLFFIQSSATFLDLPECSIDVVVSYETIEHLSDHDIMIKQIKKVLKSDGILIISSPDKKNYSDKSGYRNPFHVKELYTNEFENLIKKYFDFTVMLYQKSIVGSIITTNNRNEIHFKEYTGNYNEVSDICIPNEAMFNICLASSNKSSIESMKFDSIFCVKTMTDFYFNSIDNYFQLNESYNLVKNQLNSNSYKLGKLLTAPLRFFKSLIKGSK